MQIVDQFGVLEVFLVIIHEHFSSLLIQSALGKRHNEQTLNDLQNIVD